VETLKFAVVAFAATDTEAGTVSTPDALFVRPTVAPPAGAAFDNVTVQEESPFELRLVGVHCSDVTVAAVCSVIEADAVPPFAEAVTVAVWSALREAVEIPNMTVVAFAATDTEVGTVSEPVALFVRVTETPPAGAAFDNVTVQLALLFTPRVLGEHCKSVTFAGDCKETVVGEFDPFSAAVSVAV
jgi:hypothetical protein